MNSEDCAFIAGVILGIIIGVGSCGLITTAAWRKESVGHGFAEYDSKTGQWQWKIERNVNRDKQ